MGTRAVFALHEVTLSFGQLVEPRTSEAACWDGGLY